MGLHDDMIANGLKTFDKQKFDRVAQQLQQERTEYLTKVKNGRSLPGTDPLQPALNAESEMRRQDNAITMANRKTRQGK